MNRLILTGLACFSVRFVAPSSTIVTVTGQSTVSKTIDFHDVGMTLAVGQVTHQDNRYRLNPDVF